MARRSALKNTKFTQALVDVIKEAGVTEGCPKAKGNLLYTTASKHPANALVHRPMLLEYILAEKIKTTTQLDGAFEYLKRVGGEPADAAAFDEAAGVGVVVTGEQSALLYHFNTNLLLAPVTKALRWADGAAVRAELAAQVEALLGPKTEADLAPPEKKKKPKADKPKAAPKAEEKAAAAAAAAEPEEGAAGTADDPYAFMPKPEDNNQVHTTVNFSDGSVMRIANSPAVLARHLAATGGKVVTRFPPEPNGYLHIGHAKAMFVDFGMAAQYGGVCYLRYDDTNPEAEKQEYIDHIQEIVSWMGWSPWRVTYASQYFAQLHAYAIQLIKAGKAFVCHQSKAEIEESRDKGTPSPWRERSVEENLRLFGDMRRGLYREGEATLRMKMDHKNENPNMWDSVAYRIKYVQHPMAGDEWCIYPSYDFTHCLCDSIEDITHSLCTLEFESRRASYYWLLDVLDTYKPVVWEYSRLNITNTVLSKRKLNRLVTEEHVHGWDDPRLLTLAGLRRRGVAPESVNAFCREIGITRNANVIPYHKLEHHVRLHLDAHSPRTLAVLRPLKVVLTNVPEQHSSTVQGATLPGRPESSSYDLPFSRVVYIEATDFRLQDSKDYYGLAPGKSAMLRYAYPITVTGYSAAADGSITEVQAEADLGFVAGGGKKPPKGVLNWVAQPAPGRDPERAEVRLYDVLFKSEAPDALGDAWLDDISAASLEVVQGAMVNPHLAASAKAFDRFQFERLGYFCVDPDSKPGQLVFNRTVTLKDSFKK
ncbi:tRNA synthetases class I, catalytic domain-containing protein [Scenedesmus sp. NREL 46B-D3]|nr:tRNA synthetases class I, catalytic domain-containing protein [Scenedesmus sp. NREL 46B-D3]